jgi:hypothetical protein
MARNITAADAVYALTIPTLYSTAQILQGFMADRAFETDAVDTAETVLGVDGHLSAGWVPHTTMQTISIMPDSLSSDIFETWLQTQDANRALLPANATIRLTGTQKEYTLKTGYLRGVVPIPAAAKVLQGRAFRIEWNYVTVAPLA